MNTLNSSSRSKSEIVAFGGGCFWCTEAVFLQLQGVLSVISGYAGGKTVSPTYNQVSMGNTGHAEVIQIEYDPSVIPFSKLLDVFFVSHDPTTLNRQGADVGTQYRSTILYTTPEQKQEAEDAIRHRTESHTFENPIVTELAPLDAFYPAESCHQNYAEKNSEQSYVEYVVKPKVEKVERQFSELLKKK